MKLHRNSNCIAVGLRQARKQVRVDMTRRTNIAFVICLFTLIVSLADTLAGAQDFMPPPPRPMPPPAFHVPIPGPLAPGPMAPNSGCVSPIAGCPPTCYGPYHITVGAKWRRFSASFIPDPQPVAVNSSVTVPFGPSVAGNVNYTGGVWTYWNGSFINSYDPHATLQDQDWTLSLGPLGHNDNTFPNPTPPPNFLPQNNGSFGIIDPSTQGVAPGQLFSDTRSVTFQLNNVGNTISLNPAGASKTTKDSDAWSPYIEFGFQYSNTFDLFLGFSEFTFNKSNRTQASYNFQGSVMNAVDTFTFISNNSRDAMPTPFLSTAIGGPGQPMEGQYQLDPTSGTRSFVTSAVQSSPLGSLTEMVASKIDVTMYEIRTGARTWYPLNGFGRLTVAAGPLFAWIPYNVATSILLTNPADIIDPNTQQLIFAANRVFRQTNKFQSGTWFDFGGFASAGLELGTERWFLMSEFGFDGYFLSTHCATNNVDTTFNPSGWSITMGAGMRF